MITGLVTYYQGCWTSSSVYARSGCKFKVMASLGSCLTYVVSSLIYILRFRLSSRDEECSITECDAVFLNSVAKFQLDSVAG